MKTFSPKQKLNQALIVSKLLEKPLRFKDLWKAVKIQVKSKDQFVGNLRALEKKKILRKVPKSRKFVIYKIRPALLESNNPILSLARRISPSGSVELIADCLQFFIDSDIFSNKEQAIQAAIDFWVERYRNLCVLNALYSLPIFDAISEEGKEEINKTTMMRRMYQFTEDKFFEVILRYSRKHPKSFRSILERKLFLKGIELKPSWLGMRMSKFLETYYPQAYKKLGVAGKAQMYSELRKKEGEKEYFKCLKFKQELPQGICNLCEHRPLAGTCKHRKTPSVRERILSKRQKKWPKDLI